MESGKMMDDGDSVLRTASVSPLDHDKDTLSLTRKNASAFFHFLGDMKMEEMVE